MCRYSIFHLENMGLIPTCARVSHGRKLLGSTWSFDGVPGGSVDGVPSECVVLEQLPWDPVQRFVEYDAYNASFPNWIARPRPVLRTTPQSRINDSEVSWSLGFFGTSFETVPNPNLTNASALFNVVVIPEGDTENNTLASFDSCFNDDDDVVGYLGHSDLLAYIPKYLNQYSQWNTEDITVSGIFGVIWLFSLNKYIYKCVEQALSALSARKPVKPV